MKFRKKPVVIEANRVSTLLEWAKAEPQTLPDYIARARDKNILTFNGATILIQTLEGLMTAIESDWLIQGVHGELYPCKEDIFELTYEPVK